MQAAQNLRQSMRISYDQDFWQAKGMDHIQGPSKGHNGTPVQNPTAILNNTLLSIMLTVAHMSQALQGAHSNLRVGKMPGPLRGTWERSPLLAHLHGGSA